MDDFWDAIETFSNPIHGLSDEEEQCKEYTNRNDDVSSTKNDIMNYLFILLFIEAIQIGYWITHSLLYSIRE